jgi:Skp family chaperone for outer membrane proteins
MRLSTMTATAGAALFWASALTAQDTPALPPARRIAVVDLTRVFNEYKLSNELARNLARMGRQYKLKLERLRREIAMIRSTMEQYARGTPEWQGQQEKLKDKTGAARVLSREAQTRENVERARMVVRLYKDTCEVVREYASRHDLDLVIKQQTMREYTDEELGEMPVNAIVLEVAQRTVLYHVDGLDITEPVLEKLNAAYDRRKAAEGAGTGAAGAAGGGAR